MSQSLRQYADKRFRFAGKDQLEVTDPYFKPLDLLREQSVRAQREFVSFANYDYLGLAKHPAVLGAAEAAVHDSGVGALASRIIGGERQSHRAFEEALASFLGMDAAVTIVSGYLANSTTIAHMLDSRDALFIDELCHNSLFAGAKACPAATFVFKHGDMLHLDELLQSERANVKNAMIVVEGLYSMDGDIADLPALVALKERHSAWLLVDEAHSIGVLGRTGRGLCEHSNVDPASVDLIVGTLSKAFASCGGFLAGSDEVIRWLRYTLPGFVYSVGMSPVIIAASHAALRALASEPDRLERLRRNSSLFLDLTRRAGMDVGRCEGIAIVPILVRSNEEAMSISDAMLDKGFFVPPIIQIASPRERPRLRFFLSAAHQEADIRRAVCALVDQLERHGARIAERL